MYILLALFSIEDMCENVTDGTKLAHPFTCTKYITCSGLDYVISSCKNNMCFDEQNGVCGQKRNYIFWSSR